MENPKIRLAGGGVRNSCGKFPLLFVKLDPQLCRTNQRARPFSPPMVSVNLEERVL